MSLSNKHGIGSIWKWILITGHFEQYPFTVDWKCQFAFGQCGRGKNIHYTQIFNDFKYCTEYYRRRCCIVVVAIIRLSVISMMSSIFLCHNNDYYVECVPSRNEKMPNARWAKKNYKRWWYEEKREANRIDDTVKGYFGNFTSFPWQIEYSVQWAYSWHSLLLCIVSGIFPGIFLYAFWSSQYAISVCQMASICSRE